MTEQNPTSPAPPTGEETFQFRVSPALVIFMALPLMGIAMALGMIAAEYSQNTAPASNDQSANINPVPSFMGSPAEDFTLTTLDGDTVRLSDYRGRVVFLNFWATWCPPCVEELPAFQQFATEQGDTGAVVLASNNSETPDTIRAFLTEHDIDLSNVPVLLDSDSVLFRRFGVLRLPTTYVIDAEGVVAAVKFGEFTVEQLYTYLESVQ